MLPFESPIAFVAKFCQLNGTTLREFEELIEFRFSSYSPPNDVDITRIATILNENADSIGALFNPEVSLYASQHYPLPRSKERPAELRYCLECIESGYHSYLHETDWLECCPIHLTKIRTLQCTGSGIPNLRKRIRGLTELFKSNCRTWPRPPPSSLSEHISQTPRVKALREWANKAGQALKALSDGQIWHSDTHTFVAEDSYGPSLSRLRALVEMPELLKPIFKTTGEKWQVESYSFPQDVKRDLDKAREFAPFWRIFEFYKGAGVRSDVLPSFVVKLRLAQEDIRSRHHICRCRWGLNTGGGFYRNWAQTAPDGWPYWGYKCPHQVAIDELEVVWGNLEKILSSRRAFDDLLRFVNLSHLMHDAALIEYLPTAALSPEGKLYLKQKEWPCCRWKDASSLTPLLSNIAEYALESAVISIRKWLYALDKGGEPGNREQLVGMVRLCENEDGLCLIRWIQPFNQNE